MNSNSFIRKLAFPFFLLLAIVPGLGACNQKESKMEKRFLALGDSYTIGESVSESARWPVQLVDSLNEEGYGFAQPQIIAQTGWTTDELAKAIDEADPEGPFDLVSLLIGVNNQYRGRPLKEYEAQFESLLKQAIGFAGNNPDKVFVVSIPDYGVTPFAAERNPEKIAEEIDAFNAAAEAIAKSYKVSFVNITPGSRRAGEDPDLVADDQLHPSGKMYTEWVAQILPVVRQRLRP